MSRIRAFCDTNLGASLVGTTLGGVLLLALEKAHVGEWLAQVAGPACWSAGAFLGRALLLPVHVPLWLLVPLCLPWLLLVLLLGYAIARPSASPGAAPAAAYEELSWDGVIWRYRRDARGEVVALRPYCPVCMRELVFAVSADFLGNPTAALKCDAHGVLTPVKTETAYDWEARVEREIRRRALLAAEGRGPGDR